MPPTEAWLRHDDRDEVQLGATRTRAQQLAATAEHARPLLTIDARLLELQRDAAETLGHVSLSGGIEQDLHALRSVAAPMLAGAAAVCPLVVVTEVNRAA